MTLSIMVPKQAIYRKANQSNKIIDKWEWNTLALKGLGVFWKISHISICLLKSTNRNNEQALDILKG
jgi:hypothetical protein